MKRAVLPLTLTILCWLAVSLAAVAGGPDSVCADLVWKLWQAARLDEELIVFSCFLLFSISVSMHVEAFRFKASYRDRFLYPQLAITYSLAALLSGSLLRHLFHAPFDDWFHLLYTLTACAGFVAVFGGAFLRILRREARA